MSSKRRVVCTGIGLVSPLGVGREKSWSALLAAQSGIRAIKEEHSFDGNQSRVAAYVPDEQFKQICEAPKHLYLVKNAKQLSRATNFALVAAHEALEDAQALDSADQVQERLRSRCGVAIGQGMVDFQDIYDNGHLILDPTKKAGGLRKMSPFFITRALINMSSGNVSIRYKTNGPNHCVSTACATGAHSIGDGFNFIRNNLADMMICGSTESSINSIAIAGFERLRALCTKHNDNPRGASRPFDAGRSGFVMGEGAGIMVLEELNHARARGVKDEQIYGEILGYGLSSDAHHLTAPSPEGLGAKACMGSALRHADLQPSSIGHINAHATSTPLGDDIECSAIEDMFHSIRDEISVTSCKGSIGHLLGGAGSVESIFAMLSCRHSLIPPTLNLDEPPASTRNVINFVRGEPREWTTNRRTLIKNSFGFGGTNASIVMSNFE